MGSALGVIASFMTLAFGPSSLTLPDYGWSVRGRTRGRSESSNMVRMQTGTGASGRGAHRRWKKRRAAGRY